jgi:hypothetical protein
LLIRWKRRRLGRAVVMTVRPNECRTRTPRWQRLLVASTDETLAMISVDCQHRRDSDAAERRLSPVGALWLSRRRFRTHCRDATDSDSALAMITSVCAASVCAACRDATGSDSALATIIAPTRDAAERRPVGALLLLRPPETRTDYQHRRDSDSDAAETGGRRHWALCCCRARHGARWVLTMIAQASLSNH